MKYFKIINAKQRKHLKNLFSREFKKFDDASKKLATISE